MDLLFGECAFDSERRMVFCAGSEVHLSRKAFDLLELLINSRPRVVSKGELQERLWPSTFVVEGNLSNLVAEVRHALRDDPHQVRYIRTVHGLGYAFCGLAGEDDRPPTLPSVACWLQLAGTRLPLTPGEHLIGRSAESVVPIDDPTTSRHHARIVVGERITLLDLGSRNGTYVKGKKINAPSVLRHGDRVTVGALTMTFLMGHPPDQTTDHPTASGRGSAPPTG